MEQADAATVCAPPMPRATHRDASAYRIRPVERGDEEAASRMFSHSSAEDLRLRCLGAIKDFPRAAAARLAHCDPGREVAFAAIDLEAPTGAEIVGLVHLIDFPDQPGAAEFDIMVRSDVQSHGIGLRLMTQILAAARDRGLLRVVGYVAGENGAMLTLAGELGFRFERLPAGVVRVTTDL